MGQGRFELDDFIDLDRYPIHLPDSDRGKQLVSDCREMMTQETICALPCFLRPEAVSRLAAEVVDLEQVARKIDYQSTPYGWMKNDGFGDDHPRTRLFARRCSAVTTDQLNPHGLCLTLYQFDSVTEFIRRLLGYETLFRTECPNISVRLNIMNEGDEFGWHFDTNDGVVSFIIQNADNGGIFEYAPLIRSESDENYSEVDRLFSGADQPRQADLPAGTFILFLGRRSLHRVSRVGETTRCRHSLLFSYHRQPGMVFPEKIRNRLLKPSSEPFRGI